LRRFYLKKKFLIKTWSKFNFF